MAGKFKLSVSDGDYHYNPITGIYDYFDLITRTKDSGEAIQEFLEQVKDAKTYAEEIGESSTITLTFKIKGKSKKV